VRAAAALLQFAGRPVGDHLAVIDHHDAVRQGVRLVQVLGGQQQGDAGADQIPDHLPDALPAHRVQAGGRLIQEQHGRLRQQAGRQVQPAPHAAGIALDYPVGGVGQLEELEQFGGPRPGLARSHPAQLADQHEVLPAGQQPVQGGVLGGHADLPAHRGRPGQHVDAGHPGLARVRPRQRGQDPHGCGLPGSVRAGKYTPQHTTYAYRTLGKPPAGR
jgi:hypothetical protein